MNSSFETCTKPQNQRGGRPVVIDLFCGVGGLTYGFREEGFTVAAGIDLDSTCKFAFEHNNGATFILKDIEKTSSDELGALFPDECIKILVGCAPCQPFSKYTNRREPDDKWK